MARSDDYDPYEDEEEIKPKVSLLTIVLCILNVAAAGGFVYLLFMDLEKRQAWSYAVFLHDVAIVGLPLEQEELAPSASRVVLPKVNLRPEQLQSAYQQRKGGSIRETFQAVDEQLPVRIRPSHLNDDNLKDIFGDLKPTVKTLEEEIKLIKDNIFKNIDEAADEVVKGEKSESDKKQRLEKILLPLAANVHQVKSLNQRIRKVQGAELEKELKEAAQRRMLVDILQPLEMFQPGDYQSYYLERVGDLEAVKLEDLQTKLTNRLDQAVAEKFNPDVYLGKDSDWNWDQVERDSIEKRRTIAYIVFTIAHVNKPDGTPLFPRGPDRAQIVTGVYQFALTAQAYTDSLLTLEIRVLQLIRGDREGNAVQDKLERTPGFVDRYPILVQKLKEAIDQVDQAQKRLDELKVQGQKAKKNHEDRQEHLKEISDKLILEREKTKKLLYNLRLVQDSLFRAQVELADAAEINFNLEIKLREESGLKDKGGKKTP
jgi:uncharacterized phage infection (PIP) family protein YhgE